MADPKGAALSAPKWIVLGAWTFGALSFFGPDDSVIAGLGRTLFQVLAVVHAIECAVFLPRLRRAPGPLGNHLVRTFIYGILYVRELPASEGGGGGAAGG